MLVNRIYFRGLKTFEWVFLLPIILLVVLAQAQTPQVNIESAQVARNPEIYELRVQGACHQAEMGLEVLSTHQRKNRRIALQRAANKANKTIWSARFQVELASDGDDPHARAIEVTIACSEHGNQQIEHHVCPDPPDFQGTPDWAKGLVWYQVFPERFRDGNPQNNPNGWDVAPVDWDLGFDELTTAEVERAWNRRLVDPRAFAYPQSRPGGAIAGLIFDRRYGGDLIGVYDQLESLRDQGITGIYLCPVFQSRSLHKYDASDYRHIDPTLGDPGVYTDPGPGHTALLPGEDPADESTWAWTPGDRWFIDVFLPKAKSLGLRVILDGVWNHVGTDHFAFNDVVENGDQSVFADWFDVEFDDQGKLYAWQGWGRVNGNLPEFAKTENNDLVEGPRAHIMAVTRRWMDPNGDGDPSDGIDGWRLDVADEIGASFWKDWRQVVKELNPQAVIIAEIWGDADRMLNDNGFDGQMNYPFAFAVADWLSIGQARGDAAACARRLRAVFEHHPRHDLVQMNLMTSHDTERLASLMHNDFQRGYDRQAGRWTPGTAYESDVVEQGDRDRAIAAFAVMVASPGSMMIYNGDEYALPGADDPDNRRPIPWGLIEQEADDPQGSGAFNAVVGELARLGSDPKFEKVLRFGQVEFDSVEDLDGEKSWLLVRRRFENQMIEFMISNGRVKSNDPPAWGARNSQWSEIHESSRKFGMRTGRSMVYFRYLIANGEVGG